MSDAVTAGALVLFLGLGLVRSVELRFGLPSEQVPATVVGTSTIEGTVVDADGRGTPVANAHVTITGPNSTEVRTEVTDDSGRFQISGLTAGLVEIRASSTGYAPGAYGSRGASPRGTRLALRPGDSARITIRLSRVAVIAGEIREASGAPIPELLVFALDAGRPDSSVAPTFGRDRVTPMSTTDRRGRYRFGDLVPAEYLIVALSPNGEGTRPVLAPTPAEIDSMLVKLGQVGGLGGQAALPRASATQQESTHPRVVAPMFYPGTPRRSMASLVSVAPGERREDVSFVMAPVTVTTIKGIVLGLGMAGDRTDLSITPAESIGGFGLAGASPTLSSGPDAAGAFTFTNVTAGRYRIVARSTAPMGSGSGAPGDTRFGVIEVETGEADVQGINIPLYAATSISGRISLDALSAGRRDLTQFRVSLAPVTRTRTAVVGGSTRIGDAFVPTQPIAPAADGAFEWPAVPPGRYFVQATGPTAGTSGWWAKSAFVGERDVLDGYLEIVPGDAPVFLKLTMTERHSELSGTLQSPEGTPAPDYDIVVIPADQSLWHEESRRIRTARPASDGEFVFHDLPAGAYLLAAVTDVEHIEWRRRSFMDQVSAMALRVTVQDGKKTVQNLRIAK